MLWKGIIISFEEVKDVLHLEGNNTSWHRLHHDRCSWHISVVYKKYFQPSERERQSCSLSAYFWDNEEETITVCYGMALVFLKQRSCSRVHIVVVARWASSEIHEGEQGELFPRKGLTTHHYVQELQSSMWTACPIWYVWWTLKCQTWWQEFFIQLISIEDMREPICFLSGELRRPEIFPMALFGLQKRKKRQRNVTGMLALPRCERITLEIGSFLPCMIFVGSWILFSGRFHLASSLPFWFVLLTDFPKLPHVRFPYVLLQRSHVSYLYASFEFNAFKNFQRFKVKFFPLWNELVSLHEPRNLTVLDFVPLEYLVGHCKPPCLIKW